MSFQALARTWRPRSFDQLVGQEHVVRALTHALDHNKLHHALLFSGTRGVGKTSLARIIAKCLNCEKGVSATPCTGEDACATCREIDEGRYVDLIEVDAASRTGVDDTRELMDNVQYAPTRGRVKVYLIDEVHMLTKHSFNALLKTLEEPPPSVQFLLATTEPEKIPVTVLSRCLQFPLKRLTAPRIAERLTHIVNAESITADEEALLALARAADGSVRDALSLLDQAVAFGGGQIQLDEVRDMLGTIGETRVIELVDAIVATQPTEALAALESLHAQGLDMRYLLEALATGFQHIATIQVVGEPIEDTGVLWQDSAARLSPELTQLFYDIAIAGLRDYAFAPAPLVAVRMAVLRMLAFNATESAPSAGASSPQSVTAAAGPTNGAASASPSPPAPASSPRMSARDAVAQARAQLMPKPATSRQSPGRSQTPAASSAADAAEAPASPEDEDAGDRPASAQHASAGVEKTGSQADTGPEEVEAVNTPMRDGDGAKPLSTDGAKEDPQTVDDETANSSTAGDDDIAPGDEEPRIESDIASKGEADAVEIGGAAENNSLPTSGSPATTAESRPMDFASAEPPMRAPAAPSEPADNTEHVGSEESNAAVAENKADEAMPADAKAAGPDHPEDWHRIVARLDVSRFAAQLASNATCRRLDNESVELELARAHAFLVTDDAKSQLATALDRLWPDGASPRLGVRLVDMLDDTPARRHEASAEMRQQDAVASIENDPIIRRLRDELGAQLRPETIKPHRRRTTIQPRDKS